MEAVLGLIPDAGARPFDYLVADLLAPVRGEAMEHDRVGRRDGDDIRIDRPVGEDGAVPLDVRLLPHACPDIGVDDIRTRRRRERVAEGNGVTGGGDLPLRRAELVRRRENETVAEHPRSLEPGAGGIRCAVADVRNPHPRDATPLRERLLDGEDIRENLHRVRVVREGINNGHGGGRHLQQPLGGEGAVGDRVAVPGEDARGVADRLARAEGDLSGAERQRMRAQLRDADFERAVRPQARLFEDCRDGSPREDVRVAPLRRGLQARREVQHVVRLRPRKIRQTKKIAFICQSPTPGPLPCGTCPKT